MSDYLAEANDEFQSLEEEPMSLGEFLEECQEDPSIASHSVRYLLEAIDSCGTRTVIEKGQEIDRYRFFDDPYGDGEHAILGNSKMLNEFVAKLRNIASDRGDVDKIIWFEGPTACGKSELKRCLISGLRGYSKKDEGKRYTIEWRADKHHDDWYRSPVNSNPLTLLPEQTRQKFLDDINADEDYAIRVNSSIDPFSKETISILKDKQDRSQNDLFKRITSNDHLRISRYIVDEGQGIGVLHAEDTGSVKERLVGGWLEKGRTTDLHHRGSRNPHYFSYDGVLAQGNTLISIIEEGLHHTDLIHKLLNIIEEDAVKLDKKTRMEIDTILMIMSNPDFEEEVNQYQDKKDGDPYKSLRRRLDKYKFQYLTNYTLETLLLRRKLTESNEVWECYGEEAMEKAAEPLHVYDCELSPHTLEAAAVYDVMTRSRHVNSHDSFLEAMEKGFSLSLNGKRNIVEEIPEDDLERCGDQGIPVTFTMDVIAEMAEENDLIMPYQIVDEIQESIGESSIFSSREITGYQSTASIVQDYVIDQLGYDVLDAMVGDEWIDIDEVENYINDVLDWKDWMEGRIDEKKHDPYKLKDIEQKFFSADSGEYDSDGEAKSIITAFRENRIINALNRHIYDNKQSKDDIDYMEIPEVQYILQPNDWSFVDHVYPNFNARQWESPASNSETEEVKEKTIRRMQKLYGYSEESAERASYYILTGGYYGH